MREVARGAEAIIFENNSTIVKDRIKKGYRIKEIDDDLRSLRTRKEANLLRKLTIAHPKLIATDKKQTITMEKVEGQKISDVLDSTPALAKRIGEMAAEMHNQHTIHGDLTTSNMMLRENNEVVFIDFGLSFQSHKIEDKAVDIHLFKQALNSKHHKTYEQALRYFLEGYKHADKCTEILARLKDVELRGRYRKG